MGEQKRRAGRPQRSRYRASLGRELRFGVVAGLSFATLYGAYALVLYAVRGRGPFTAGGVSLAAVLGAYAFGGLAAGTLVGLLHPLRRSLPGQLALGVVCATVVFAGVVVATDGWPSRWSAGQWQDVAVLGALFGVAAPLALRRVWRGPPIS